MAFTVRLAAGSLGGRTPPPSTVSLTLLSDGKKIKPPDTQHRGHSNHLASSAMVSAKYLAELVYWTA